jgi:hypothetical protein
MSKYETNIALLIQIAWLGAIVVLGFCFAPGCDNIAQLGSRGLARSDLVDDRTSGWRQNLAPAVQYRNVSNRCAGVTA